MTIERATFTATIAVKREEVPMPEFGEGASVFIYGLTAKEKASIDGSMMNKDWTGISRTKYQAQKARIIIASARDEAGGRIFNDDDVNMISDWPSAVVERLSKVADRLNGTTSEKDLAKNSDETGED